MPGTEYIDRCLAGDQSAWRELIDEYAGLVYAIARAHSLDEPSCDDVAQTVFAALSRCLADLRVPGALPGWLSTTTKRECWRILAGMRRERTTESMEELNLIVPDERIREIEDVQRVRRALVELGGRCQRLLTALFLASGQPDYRTIAHALDIPVGSIGPTRARCLSKLASILERSE